MSRLVCFILNRLFNNRIVLINNLDHIQLFLINLNNIIQIGNLNNCSSDLLNTLFSMIFNLIQIKLEMNKHVDLSLLNGISEFLIDNLTKINKMNMVISFSFCFYLRKN